MKIQIKEVQKGMRIKIGTSPMNYSYEVLDRSQKQGLIVLTMQAWSAFASTWILRRRPTTLIEIIQ